MPELDFHGLRSASQAAFKPHFAEVVRLAGRRRRRTRAVGAVAVAAALAAGTGVAVHAAGAGSGSGLGAPSDTQGTPNFIPSARASVRPTTPNGRHAEVGAMVAGDLTHVYVHYGDCQARDCTAMVAASADGGATWTKRPLPVPHNALVELIALAPRTVLAWAQDEGSPHQTWHSTVDGGQTWREITARTADVIPAGWLPLDVPSDLDTIPVLAADPATGDLVQLAQSRTLAMARIVAGLPAAAGLWVTGFTGTKTDVQPVQGTGSAVDVSHDGGRTWRHTVLPENVNGNYGLGAATVASYDGQTAYAIGAVGGALVVYRTTDGGATWQRAAPAGPVPGNLGERWIQASVQADGALLIQVGLQAGDNPVMLRSTDGGRTVTSVPVAPGAAAVPMTGGGYAQSGWPNSTGVWLSATGADWSYVGPPILP